MARFLFDIRICRQCSDPHCLPACPTGAMALDERGVVTIEEDVCIGCGACADACPFDTIFPHEVSHRYLKCDLCAGRTEGPLCVQLCPAGALALTEEQD
jgi:Fe-S-cluster-containing dehydrogenase component